MADVALTTVLRMSQLCGSYTITDIQIRQRLEHLTLSDDVIALD